MHSNTVTEISAKDLQQLMQGSESFLLLDVREPNEYEYCNLGGRNIPLNQLPSRMSELDRNQMIIVHCRSGHRSMQAIEILQAAGFDNLKNYRGGILAWAREVDNDFPVY